MMDRFHALWNAGGIGDQPAEIVRYIKILDIVRGVGAEVGHG